METRGPAGLRPAQRRARYRVHRHGSNGEDLPTRPGRDALTLENSTELSLIAAAGPRRHFKHFPVWRRKRNCRSPDDL